MSNTIGKIFAVLLAVLLFFVYPLMHMFEQQDKTSRIFVFTETTAFVDAIRNTGHLTPQMYEEFTRKLSATDNIYEIGLEHRHKRLDPVYGDPLDPTTFQEAYVVNYATSYTEEIMNKIFPELGNQETYEFSNGDYLLVRIINKNKTLGTRVKELLLGSALPTQTIFVQYGGMIK